MSILSSADEDDGIILRKGSNPIDPEHELGVFSRCKDSLTLTHGVDLCVASDYILFLSVEVSGTA